MKLTASTGLERNGQAYTAVPDSTLRRDPRYNPLDGVGDHYRESFATLNYTRLVSTDASVGLTAYGFHTTGYYDYPSGTTAPPLRYRSASRWGGVIGAAHVVRKLAVATSIRLTNATKESRPYFASCSRSSFARGEL